MADMIQISREQIRKQLLESYAKALGIDGSTLDTSESSFSSYIFNALSALVTDSLIYASYIASEGNLITAQLPESIINWAKYLAYTPQSAKPATGFVLVQIPLQGTFKTIIQPNHKFYAGDTVFVPRYQYIIDNTDKIQLYMIDDQNIPAPVPYSIDTIDNKTYLSFLLQLYQEDIYTEEFTVPTLKDFEFYSKTITIPDGYYVNDVRLFVNNKEWKKGTIVTSAPMEEVFEWTVVDNKLLLSFGNNIFAKQPSGIVTVQMKITKGSKGNVGPYTIDKTDILYNINVTPPTRIDVIVTNTDSFTGGQDIETLSDIKRNAPRSLSMLNRIVSKTDYQNIYKIMYGDDVKTYPILKRSDVAVNDIYVYTILRFRDKIVPTDTITIPFNSDTKVIYTPDSTFIKDGVEWICPFLIEADPNKKIASYRYIPQQILLNLQTFYRTQNSKTFVSSGQATYDSTTDTVTLKLYVYINSIDINQVSQILAIRYTNSYIEKVPDDKKIISNNFVTFIYQFSRNELVNALSVDIKNLNNQVLDSIYSTKFDFLAQELNTYSPIYTLNKTTYILDVPVILKSYYDSLSDNDKRLLSQLASTSLVILQNALDKRMMNVNISGKFARTYGQFVNYKYSTPDYYIYAVVHSTNELNALNKQIGQYVAISDPITNPNDALFKYAGNLYVWTGKEWNLVLTPAGTLVKYQDTLLISDGRRWLPPDIKVPLNIDLEVHTDSLSGNLYDSILQTILRYINDETGINDSIHLSVLIDKIHDIPGVRYIRINYPMTDIVYRNIEDNLTKEQMLFYTPEYIHTDIDHIRITFKTR